MKRVAAVLAIAALVAVAPPPQNAATAKIGEWNLKTDEMSANLFNGAFDAPHHVTLTRADGSIIVADRANGNYKKRQANLFGHVSVHDASGTFGLSSAQSEQSRGPATLTSDELRLDDGTHLYDAKGNVHYEQGQTTVDAQTAHLNDATHELDLTGKVHVVQIDRTLDADSATYNTVTGDGEANTNVLITFPGVTPTFATPKPLKVPKIP
jgi:lipopolysaccharide assembly outer membrane protein LptD (OstA)